MVAGATLRLANNSLEIENRNRSQVTHRVACMAVGGRVGWVIECRYQEALGQVGALGGKVACED